MSNCHAPRPAPYHSAVTGTMPGTQVTSPAPPWCQAGFAGTGTVGHQTPTFCLWSLGPFKARGSRCRLIRAWPGRQPVAQRGPLGTCWVYKYLLEEVSVFRGRERRRGGPEGPGKLGGLGGKGLGEFPCSLSPRSSTEKPQGETRPAASH